MSSREKGRVSEKKSNVALAIAIAGVTSAGFSWLENRSTREGAKTELAAGEVLQLDMLQRLVRVETILEHDHDEELGVAVTVDRPVVPVAPIVGRPTVPPVMPDLAGLVRPPNPDAMEGLELIPPDVLFGQSGTSAVWEQGGSAPRLRSKPKKDDARVQRRMEQYSW